MLNNATNVSDNGYIVGSGTDAAGNTAQAFRLQLLPGDANLDGTVDINDLTIVLSHFGGSGMAWDSGDFNGDGNVDVNDLTIVLANFGSRLSAPPASLAAVPEPCALALVLGAALLGPAVRLGLGRRL